MDAITGLLPLLQVGATGGGLVGNVIGQVQRGQEVDALRKQQKILSDPAAVSKMVAQATQPLDQGLVQAVGNQVQGTEAERGLATSPGISASIESQALAPYVQQNQSLALNQVLSQLSQIPGFGQLILGGGGGGASMSPAIMALMKQFQQPTTPKPTPQIPTDYGGSGISDYSFNPTDAFASGFSQAPTESYT